MFLNQVTGKTETWLKTTYYVGAYEKELVSGGYPKNIHYIYGGDGLAAIYTTQSSNSDMYYVHKDHLGSIDKITNSSKIVIQKTSFDAWGRRRNPDNWTYTNIPATIFSRGYTGHEHLDLFDLINMNGRLYDPILGRFLSPDNFVQNSSNSQGYNRYSYCFNNPLKYIDPSGWQLAPIDQYWNLGTAPGNFGNFFGSPLQERNACPYTLGSDGIYYNKAGFIVSAQEVLMNYILPNCMGGLTLEITSSCEKVQWNDYEDRDSDLAGTYSNLLLGLNANFHSNSKIYVTLNASGGGGSLNWSEIGSSSVGLLLGIGEGALGVSGEFFTGGLSTALVIDGGIRVVSNATKLGLLFSGNNRSGVATPSNAGGWVGKMIDMASGSNYGEISTGQGIGSFTNDFTTFTVSGGSALSLSKALMYPSLSSVYGYGLTITGTPYTAQSDLINWYNSKK